ncbi:MAG TPA: 50S ribosomal protein L25 [Dehalococcoidia bacterium]|nr:50S ribosomal protein L25 [Dehalococcoidia bacterium]
MKRLELEASKREVLGKKVRFLRRQGLIPANIYGHGINSIPVQLDAKSLKQLLANTGTTDLISLKITGSKTPVRVLVRDVQRNPLTDELLHVDFYQVEMTERIKVEVPLVFIGEAPVLDRVKGTSLLHLVDSLYIEALPDDLPHSLEVDLSLLKEADDAIYVKDIQIGDGITLLSDPEQMVVKVVEARREVEAAPVEVEGEVTEGEEVKADTEVTEE